MQTIKKITLLLLFSLISLVCCKKDEPSPLTNEYMQATINGKEFLATHFVVAKAAATTSINGTLGPASNATSIGISIREAKVGSFPLSEDTDYFAVYKSPTDEYLSLSGTLQITSLTAEWIEGNFSFEAHSINDFSERITISDGKLRIKID
jgi:hypothetical protein